jgi:hypothetical protein
MTIRKREPMAADERRSTPMNTKCLSAFIGVHRRLIGLFSPVPEGAAQWLP